MGKSSGEIFMKNSLINLYQHRELLWMWMFRELKIRYKQSVLGIAWAILQPLALTIIFSIVFSFFTRIPTGDIPYPVFAYVALLPWTFFMTSINFSVPCLVTNLNLVTKIYFPREILPISAILAAFVDFSIAWIVLIGLFVFYGIKIYISVLWIPVLVFVQIIFTIGIALFLSALNVRYRDIRFVIPLALQVWMYACPIIYPLDMVPQKFQWLYLINPMASLVEFYRRVTLEGQHPQWDYLMICIVISSLFFILGYAFFKKAEIQFADII